ncbi:hypothetical protein MESS2_540013 [Mesorhizobium metallidurans STM 2683]|uniref:Uncharacterized protein n=1 Tax=Mesorhizobium metallidurans STM 2683 TaxID=1297569 RepID=M5F666_9HYPH|nr:hypothetical protein MESS2_540013 [Mesorhizobium metallidurans STM 2683]
MNPRHHSPSRLNTRAEISIVVTQITKFVTIIRKSVWLNAYLKISLYAAIENNLFLNVKSS